MPSQRTHQRRAATVVWALVASAVSLVSCRRDPSARSTGVTEAGSGRCDGVLRDCDGKSDNGCETRIGTTAHCGDFNQRCSGGEQCVGTSCQPAGDLAMAPHHTCVLDLGGRVRCWGANANGELGDGTRVLRDRPVAMAGIDDAVQLVVRERQTCVRRAPARWSAWVVASARRAGAISSCQPRSSRCAA